MTPIRFHHLKAMALSPAHCRYALDLSERDEQGESTPAMQRGTATHAMLFGTVRVMTAPEDAPRKPSSVQRNAKKPSPATIDAIAWWDAFERESAGAIVMPAAQYDTCARMADAVRAEPRAAEMLHGATVEESILFNRDGLECRTTPDIRGLDFECELKTTKSSQPEQFVWQSKRMLYHAQHAWHLAGMRGNGLLRGPGHAYTIAVEATAPYVVTVFRIDPHALEIGERCTRLWFERVKSCIESGQWPGYAQSVVDLDVPEDLDELALSYEGDDTEADAA